MKPEQITEELQQPGAIDLLRDATLLHLSYQGVDGLPRVIPIGFYWTGARIVVCTAITAPKVRALSRAPHVAVAIDSGASPENARSLLVRGYAELETVEGIPDEYLASSAKTMDPSAVVAFEEQVKTMYSQMVRISIEPRWARFYDFGVGRMPTFLEALAAG